MKTVLLEHYILFERKPKETVLSAVHVFGSSISSLLDSRCLVSKQSKTLCETMCMKTAVEENGVGGGASDRMSYTRSCMISSLI